jgi:uncharacterized protein (DUF302 family)
MTMASQGIPYGFEQRLPNATFGEPIERVTAALQEEGFGVLTKIDVTATLKNKLGVDMRVMRTLATGDGP